MAPIECPDCGRQVLERDSACVGCGRLVGEFVAADSLPTGSAPPPNAASRQPSADVPPVPAWLGEPTALRADAPNPPADDLPPSPELPMTEPSETSEDQRPPLLTQNQLLGEVAWVVITLLVYWATYSDTSKNPQYSTVTGVQCIGCYFVGKHRGRSGWWALIGLLPIICLALPCLLPPTREHGARKLRISESIAGAVATVVVGFAVVAFSVRSRASEQISPPLAWRARDVLGLRLMTPVELRPNVKAIDAIPAEDRASLESVDSHAGASGGDGVSVRVDRVVVRTGFEIPNDPYVDLLLHESAAAAGDTSPTVQVAACRISGLAAERGTCTMNVRGQPMRSDVVSVVRGQTRWTVFVIYKGTSTRPESERVLSSVEILQRAEGR